MSKRIDLSGKTYSKLFVLHQFGLPNKWRDIKWLCKCECGNYVAVSGSSLKMNNTKSCGCYLIKRAIETHTKHGHSPAKGKSLEYQSWKSMKSRCYDENKPCYKYYGGKGIKVCDRWRYSFENFHLDMGKRPSKYYTLDRYPNKNGNYEPDNCRWATKKEQSENRGICKIYEYNGVSMILSQWVIVLNARRTCIDRSLKRGKSFKEIVEYYKNKGTCQV